MLFFDDTLNNLEAENVRFINEFIEKNSTMTLATKGDSDVRIAIINKLVVSDLNEVYFMSNLSSNKVQNILENGNVELLFYNDNQVVVISGQAELVESLAKKQELYEEWMDMHLNDGYQDKEYALVKVTTCKVRGILYN